MNARTAITPITLFRISGFLTCRILPALIVGALISRLALFFAESAAAGFAYLGFLVAIGITISAQMFVASLDTTMSLDVSSRTKVAIVSLCALFCVALNTLVLSVLIQAITVAA